MIAPQSKRLTLRVVVVLLLLVVGIVVFRSWQQSQPDYPWYQAVAAKDRGDLDAARLHVQTLLENCPDHAEGHELLSRLYLSDAKSAEGEEARVAYAKALHHLERTVQLKPNDFQLQTRLLRAYIDTERWKQAAKVAATVEKFDGRHSDALLALARAEIDAQRFEEGERWLTRLFEVQTDPPFTTRALPVRLYRSTKRNDLLQQSLDATLAQAVACSPEQLAKLNRRERKMMIRLLELSVDLAPNVGVAHPRTAEALRVFDRLAEGVEDKTQIPTIADTACRLLVLLETVHPLDPKSAPDHAARDQLCIQPQALRIAAIESGKASVLVYRQAALTAVLQGNEEQALKWTEEAIPAAEKSRQTNRRDVTDLHQIAAQILVKLRRFADARRHVQPLLEKRDYAGIADLLAGACEAGEGRHKKALERFISARSKLGTTLAVRSALAGTYIELGRWQEALPLLESLHVNYDSLPAREQAWARQSLDDRQIHFLQARAHLGLNQWDAAQPHLNGLRDTQFEPQSLALVITWFVQQQQTERATKLLREAREAFPRDLQLLNLEVAALERNGQADEAQKLLEASATAQADNLAAQLLLLDWRVQHGMHPAAKEQLNRIKQQFPEDLNVKLVEAKVLLTSGDFENARRVAEQIRAERGDDNLATLLAAAAALNQHDMTGAKQLIGSTSDNSNPGLVKLWQGGLALAEGKTDSALESLSRALDSGVVENDARHLLLQALFVVSNTKGAAAAEAEATRLLKDHPQEPALIFALAEFATSRADFTSALKYVQWLDKLVPGTPLPSYCKAKILSYQNQPQQAIAELQRTLTIDPRHVAARVLAAQQLISLQDFSTAIIHCQAALAQNPQLSDAYLLQADAQSGLDQRAEAIRTLEELVRRQPNLIAAYHRLATIHHQRGNLAAALDVLNSGRQRAPGNLQLLHAQIETLISAGRDRELAQIEPDSVPAAYLKAYSWLIRGRLDRAQDEVDTALCIEPGHLPSLAIAAEISLAASQFDLALRHAENALRQNPHASNLRLIQGAALTRIGRQMNALSVLEEVVRDRHIHEAARVADVALAAATGETDPLLQYLGEDRQKLPAEIIHRQAEFNLLAFANDGQQMAEVEPRTPWIAHAKARAWWTQNHPQQAMNELALSLQSDPNHLANRLMTTEICLASRNDSFALEHALAAIQVRPDSIEAHLLRAEVLIHVRRQGEADAIFQQAIQQQPNSLAAHRGRAVMHCQARSYDVALQAIEAGRSVHPQDLGLLQVHGEILARQGRIDQLAALQTDPATFHFVKAWTLIGRNEQVSAHMELERALAISPRHTPAAILAAEISLARNDGETALKLISNVLEHESKMWQAQLLKAEALRQLGRSSEAIVTLETLIGSQPERTAGHLALVALLRANGNLDRALNQCRTARKQLPQDADLLAAEVGILCHMDQVKQAEQLATTATESKLAFEQSIALAQAFAGERQFASAAAWAAKAAEAAPASMQVTARLLQGDIAASRGMAEDDKSKLREARDHYAAVIALEPNHWRAGNNLAWLLAAALDSPKQALEVADKLSQGTPIDELPANFVDTLAMIYRRLDRLTKAQELLEQALRSHPAEASLHLQLGLVQAATRKPTEARASLEKALEIGLRDDKAVEARRELIKLRANDQAGK